MMNRRAFKTYASMHMVYKSKQFGTELWLGDYYAATDFNLLKSKNVRSVLTAAAMLGVAYPSQLQMNHKTIHAFDIPTYKMTPHFQQAYQFIHQGLKKGNVLVHCAAGISRSTTCVLVYLMRTQGFGFNQALQFVRSKRSIINPNYGFANQLKKYELKIKKNPPNQSNNQKSQKIIGNKRQSQINQTQKKAVMNFLLQSQKNIKQTNQYNENNKKLNTTYNNNQSNQIAYSNFLRGKSTNYHYTNKNNMFGNTIGYTGNKISGQHRLSSVNNYNNHQSNNNNYDHLMSIKGHQKNVLNTFKGVDLSSIGNKMYNFKVQNPKIVTIKK